MKDKINIPGYLQANVEKIAQKVVLNFKFKYRDVASSPVEFISPLLESSIESEIKSVIQELVSELTPVQREVSNSLPFIRSIPGSLRKNSDLPCDLFNGQNFKPSGISKIYFESLDSAMIANHTIKILEVATTTFLEDALALYYPESSDTLYAAHDKLKGDVKERKQKILSHIFMELIKHANEDQLERIINELRNKNHYLANALSLQHGFKSLLVKSSPFSLFYHKAQTAAIEKFSHFKYALSETLDSSIPSYNLLKLSQDPFKIPPDQLRGLLQDQNSSFISTYAIFDDKLFYIGDICTIVSLKITNSEALKKLFPLRENDLKKASPDCIKKIQKFTGHYLSAVPELPSDMQKRLRFFLNKLDLYSLSRVNKKTHALDKKEEITKAFGRDDDYTVFSWS